MKFTIDWLKDHLETDASVKEIVETLTMTGTEVEAVENQAEQLQEFTIARVISAEKHPNADRLKVCMVDTGSGDPVKVVCGAPNAKTGMKGVFAAAGTYIPGTDFVLQKGVIRGEQSNGMLCSQRELMLSDDHDGIIELADDAPLGQKYADYAGLDQVVIEVEITPNRGDCAGVFGIARELAAAGLGELKNPAIPDVAATAGPTTIPVELRFGENEPKACKIFIGRLIKNVNNGPSPEWLQKRLVAIGLRPINALADITNYISFDRARPLHVYDADKISGTIHARMGKKGEKFDGLDDKPHEVDQSMCVIADDNGVLGLGGIMGGVSSSCTSETRNVLIECAWFDPQIIAATGRKTSIVSDARYRFERNVDPAFVKPGMEMATKLVLDICGGQACETITAGEIYAKEKIIDFPLAEIKRLTGLEVSYPEVKAVLNRLGFWLAGSGDVIKIAAPSWRPDVTIKADVVEEVMRMVGVDKVPVDPLPRLSGVAEKILTPIQNRRRIARRALAARGLSEAVTWSFVSADQAQKFGGGAPELKLANPIASDLTDMRPSLLPGLLAAAVRNSNRSLSDLALFEVGQIFKSDLPEGQRNFASAIRTGTAGFLGYGRHWQAASGKVDVFAAKSDMGEVLFALGLDIDKTQLVSEPAPWAHPGRGGRIQLGPKNILGWFGELHPTMVADLGLNGPVVAFEIDLDAIPAPRKKSSKAKPAIKLWDLMPLKRDFAFIVEAGVPAAKVIKAIQSANKSLISNVNIFDVFQGNHVEQGKKSLGLEVTLQPKNKTLTDQEIEAVSASIVAAVKKATGGELRS
ncbi:Phenylalanyl-tRNA synthetase beta chain [hydrothermal vent metagenome]|uniref:Phenylalanine--tRNA ligase beta subunit n=1 Tax=hydrothermal vent metagenome TaxID=652676 RepID=A0A3B0UTL4_9ZZZZ